MTYLIIIKICYHSWDSSIIFSGPFLIFFWMQVKPLSQTIWLLKDLDINVYSS